MPIVCTELQYQKFSLLVSSWCSSYAKNPAKDYFGFCTGANKPHLGIMLHGYFESLSGSNAKDASGWKPD